MVASRVFEGLGLHQTQGEGQIQYSSFGGYFSWWKFSKAGSHTGFVLKVGIRSICFTPVILKWLSQIPFGSIWEEPHPSPDTSCGHTHFFRLGHRHLQHLSVGGVLFYFEFCFYFGDTASGTQDLFPSLCSRITPGRAQGNIWDAWIEAGLVVCKARTLPSALSLLLFYYD